MHSIIAFLKDAVTRGLNPGVAGCYIVRDGSIYARNQAMQAGVAMPSDVDFNVPAEELDVALARMPQVQNLTIDGDTIVLRCGRLRATIKLNVDEPPPMPTLPEVWQAAPPNLARALELAQPFTGDQGWSHGIRLKDGSVRALSNAAAIDIDVPGLTIVETLLPTETAAFIVAQGNPKEYNAQPDAVCFRWPDGRWLRAQLLTDRMPDVDKVFADAAGLVDGSMIEITPDWRQAYADIAALSEGTIELRPDAIEGLRSGSRSRVDIATEPLAPDHVSKWATRLLDPVIACAARWYPSAYPSPAAFEADGLRGVVMGVRR